jgi:hypothetical protein
VKLLRSKWLAASGLLGVNDGKEIMSLNPNGAPPGYYYQTGATAYLIDPAGTYSLEGASAPTVDPAGTYSGPGASAPTLAAAGTYISVTGATSSAAEVLDPAGTYSGVGASAPTTDPAGAYSGADASAPTLAAAGAYIPVTGATSSAAEIADPAGTYSLAGASAPTLAAAGTYIPVAGATSVAAEIVSPAGTYSPAGASAPIADPGGAYSAAGASAPTTDPAGTYSSPYALDRLFLLTSNDVPVGAVLSFSSLTAVQNYFGATSGEATLASDFFAGYAGTSATMLFTRYPYDGGRSRVFSGNLANLTLSQLQSINGSLSLNLNGNNYAGSLNLSNVQSFSAAATAILNALNSNLAVLATTTGDSIAPESVSFTGTTIGDDLEVTSAPAGTIYLGSVISGPGIAAGNEIVSQLNGTPGGAGLYNLFEDVGTISSETMTVSYGALTLGSVTSGAVAPGELLSGPGIASNTAILSNISGSGPGSTWIVNNAQTVVGANASVLAPSLGVVNYSVTGATANRDYLQISEAGEFDYDYLPSTISYVGGTAAAALGLTQASGALLSNPGGQTTDAGQFMNNLVQNETDQFGSFQLPQVPALVAQYDPTFLGDFVNWAQSTYGQYTDLAQYITGTPPAGSSTPTTDPAGTYSGAGASAPTLAAAGTYIPVTGATSAAAEVVDPAGAYSAAGASSATTDPAGTYSAAGASAPTTDPAGTYSAAGASALTLAAAGTYIAATGVTSAAAEMVDPAGMYSAAGASAPTIDPAGTYSGAGASAPTIDPAGTYSGAGASAATIDPAGSYSLAGASAPTLAQPGYYVPTAGASSETPDDSGYYTPYAGATAEILALPPIISGTAAGQSAASGQPDTPFASVTIADPNIDATDSLSIQVSGAGGTLADGPGFTGLATSAPGLYLLSGSAAAITSELDALVFTPGAGSGTTTFTLTDAASVGTSASDATTSVTILSTGTEVVSVATFLADQSTLDPTVGGFDISDTAAEITASLDQLNDPNIDAITVSDNGQVGASVQQLTTDAMAISKLVDQSGAPYQLAISDTAADITAALNSLDGSNIASITISDNGAIAASVAQLTTDAAAISKLANQSDPPYQLFISGAAAYITAALNSLDGSNIASITISDNNAVGASVAQLTSDATAISKLANQSGSSYQLAVADTAADITAGLNGLNGSNIASITISDNNPVGVDVAQLTSDATAIGKLANAGGGAYQLAIADAAANLQADLASLEADVAHIAAITTTSGTVVVSVSTFAADQGALDKIVGGFAISDMAANISAGLDALDDGNINRISISSDGAVGASVAQLTSDATAIGKLANAGGGAYQLAISDTAANVQGDLASLEADVAHIAAITTTSGTVVVSVSTFAADQGALNKIGGGFGVSDSAANISASLNALNDANIDTITISDDGVVGATVAQLTSDAPAIGKLANAGGGAYQLAITDSLPNIVGELSALSSDSHVVSLTATSGKATLSGGVGVNAPAFALSGSSIVLTVAETISYSGALSEGAGSTISISSADELSLTGTAILGGTTSGAGTLDLAGGSATIESGAKLSVSNWSISGSGTDVTLGEALTYSGSFSEGAGDTFVLSGGNLLLIGAAAFEGGTVEGAKLLYTEGTITISGLTIGGTVEWVNTKTVTQTGGKVTIGDSSGDEAFLFNAAKATYDILDDSGIGLGASTASHIDNAGLFEKTGGTGASVIAPSFFEMATGTVTVASGTLSFSGPANSFAGAITGAGTLQLAGGSDSIGSGAAISVANLSISGSDTEVRLGEALTYAGGFSEAAGDTLALTGGALVLTGANDAFSGGTVDGSKFLYTEGTTAVSGLTVGGTVEWENTNTVNQSGGNVTLGDNTSPEKAVLCDTLTATYDILDDGGIGLGASTASYIDNAGLFEKTGGTGASAIAPAVTNTGTIEVTSGTLDFMRAVTGTGTDTIWGASTLEFDAAVSSSTTVGDQNIGFTGGGTLDLTDTKAFWGEVSSFAATDTIELLGSWAFSSFSENSGGALATLTLVSGTTKHAFDFVGDYTQGDFKITSGATSTITYT